MSASTDLRDGMRRGARATARRGLPPGLAVGAASLWALGAETVFDAHQIEYLKKDTPLRRLTLAADVANAELSLR